MSLLKYKITIIILISFLITGCSTVRPVPIFVGHSPVLLKDICKKNNVKWKWDSVSQIINLNYQGSVADLLVGSDVVMIGKEKIILSEPIDVVRSVIVVPVDFERRVVGNLIDKHPGSYEPLSLRYKIRQVVIDSGHGGRDSGAVGYSGLLEKDVVLDIAKRIKKILVKKSIKVIMTRSSDKFISLKKRTEIACKTKADWFISVHANSSTDSRASGVEVFDLKDMNRFQKNEEARQHNHNLHYKILNMDRADNDLQKIVSDMYYVKKQVESSKLAEKVSKNLSESLKTRCRGEKSSGFFVLRNTLIPAILVEVGFLSNPREERFLKTRKYRQKIAASIAASIMDYSYE